VHEYLRVSLRIRHEDKLSLYLRGRRVYPTFVWLEFGMNVRRR
jgi:hypothetical protein